MRRGIFTSSADRLFSVSDSNFVEIKADNTFTQIASLNTGIGTVTMAESVDVDQNKSQIMIVDGTNGYIYNLGTGVFSVITSIGYLPGTHVVYYNGYFVQNVTNTNKFIFSALYDGTQWDALDYCVAEGSSDNVTAVATVNNELWIFGGKSLEFWYVTGNLDDPFARNSSAFINNGCASPYSVQALNNNVFWLGSNAQGNNIVWMSNSYIPQRISDHGIEYQIGQLADIENCTCFTYQQEGHFFYVMNFQQGNRTLVYDVITGLWHERGYFNPVSGKNDLGRANCATLWQGKVMVGDWTNNNIYELDLDTYTDNGNTILRYRQGPHHHYDRKRLFFKEFELDLERGIGLVTGQGSRPTVMLQSSNDGGYTWTPAVGQVSAGGIGEYQARVRFLRLGQSRDRVFRVSMTDPVKWILIGARIDVEVEK